MSKRDICNVELISSDDLCDALGMLLDAAGFQAAIEDCNARWTLTGLPPEEVDLCGAASIDGAANAAQPA
jgi:hypothetical protein